MNTETMPDVVEASAGVRIRVAHYVRIAALFTGGPVEALCGYVWTPSVNPDGMPVCRPCAAVIADDLAMTLGADQVGGVTP